MATRKTTTKKTASKTSTKSKEVKVKKDEAPKAKARTLFSHIEYCNLIGGNDAIKFVANLKFKGSHKKTKAEWKKLFETEGLI